MNGFVAFISISFGLVAVAFSAFWWVNPIGKDRLIELRDAQIRCERLDGVYLKPQRTIYNRPECWVDGKRVFPEGFI